MPGNAVASVQAFGGANEVVQEDSESMYGRYVEGPNAVVREDSESIHCRYVEGPNEVVREGLLRHCRERYLPKLRSIQDD